MCDFHCTSSSCSKNQIHPWSLSSTEHKSEGQESVARLHLKKFISFSKYDCFQILSYSVSGFLYLFYLQLKGVRENVSSPFGKKLECHMGAVGDFWWHSQRDMDSTNVWSGWLMGTFLLSTFSAVRWWRCAIFCKLCLIFDLLLSLYLFSNDKPNVISWIQ